MMNFRVKNLSLHQKEACKNFTQKTHYSQGCQMEKDD
jgi:hypothetical protein